MTARRYLVCPGPVRSRTDGDWHHITARQLSHLYRVPMDECIVLPYGGSPGLDRQRDELLARAYRGELIELRPRADGDYRQPAQPAAAPARPHGCHNRAPLRDQVIDKPGYPRVVVPFRMAPDCQYTLSDLGRADQRCAGCRWRAPAP